MQKLELLAKGIDFSFVAGVPNAGNAFAKGLSALIEQPLIVLSKDGRVLDGTWSLGMRILLVENVTTTGLSIFGLAQKLRDQGMIVSDVLILVDRGQGATKRLDGCGIAPHVLFRMDSLLDFYWGRGLITPEQCLEVTEYLQENRR